MNIKLTILFLTLSFSGLAQINLQEFSKISLENKQGKTVNLKEYLITKNSDKPIVILTHKSRDCYKDCLLAMMGIANELFEDPNLFDIVTIELEETIPDDQNKSDLTDRELSFKGYTKYAQNLNIIITYKGELYYYRSGLGSFSGSELGSIVVQAVRNIKNNRIDNVYGLTKFEVKTDYFEREYYESGALKSEVRVLNGEYHGDLKKYHENGQLLGFVRYDHGKPATFVYEIFSENGVLLSRVNMVDGIRQGEYVEYNEEGELERRGTFKDGARVGLWTTYNIADDEKKAYEEHTFANDKYNGPYRLYYKKNSLAVEGTYKDDEQVGLWKWYDKKGNLEDTENFDE